MKKFLIGLVLIAFVGTVSAQKNDNGKVYDQHPSINLAEKVMQLFAKGDPALADYLTDEFKSFNGLTTNKDAEGADKQRFLNQSKWMSSNFDYFKISRNEPAYPDAIEYKDSGVWVQTWETMYGVNKETGIKIDMPVHRLFLMSKDGKKVHRLISYFNTEAFSSMWDSYETRTNGVIYNQHEYINSVRKMASANENNDMDTVYGFYAEDARLYDINLPFGEFKTLEQAKADDKVFRENFEILSIDEWGYPDYYEYEIDAAKVVASWWKVKIKRKADDKEFTLLSHYTHTFNDEGKVIRSSAYYNASMLSQ